MSTWRRLVLLWMTTLPLISCTAAQPAAEEPLPARRPAWRELPLPRPDEPGGRLMLRDVAWCRGRWWVVGAIGGPGGTTRPGIWTSVDGSDWTTPPLQPISYYGHRAIFYAVGCRAGQVAAIGAKAGGAHGNPRVRTWRQLPDGSVAEVPAEFELYGGPEAVSTSRIAGGPGGWLIAGARSGGAAVWRSADGQDFRLVDDAPGLASAPGLTTLAVDAVALDNGWLVGGAGRLAGRPDSDPLVWSSPDGMSWNRANLPADDADEVVQRLNRLGPDLYALGVRGGTFAAWRLDPTSRQGWRLAGRFGVTGTGAVAGVEASAGGAGSLLAMTVGAQGHQLWQWTGAAGAECRAVALPVLAPPGGDTAASVASDGNSVLVLVDDGVRAGVWMAPVSGTG